MTMMKAHFYGQTDIGRVRPGNEDDFVLQHIWDDNHILCLVADGLGGYEGGEVAAGTATATIKSHLLMDKNEGKLLDLLKQAVIAANNAIVAVKKERPELSEMGCVITAGIIDLETRQLSVVHVGDTRLYRISKDGMSKLTHDHSPVGYMEEKHMLTEEEAMAHPHRNVINRFLGEAPRMAEDPEFIDAAIFPISPGEILLFCSDGLHDMLTSAEIMGIVSNDCKSTVRHLIDEANDKGGRDNITVIAVSMEETDPLPNGDDDGGEEESLSDGASKEEATTTDLVDPPSAHDLPSHLWLSCLLAGLVAGYAIGNWNMSSSMKELTDTVNKKCLLVDSLRSILTAVPRDTLFCDTLASDTLQNDIRAQEKAPGKNEQQTDTEQ